MLNGTAGQPGVHIDLRGTNLDHEKFLAEALGITTEKLQAAEETAAKAELAQAVTDGRMTQAQADQITAERALQKYIVDNGLFKSAVDSTVQAGVITQAQADTILAQDKVRRLRLRRHGRGSERGGFDGDRWAGRSRRPRWAWRTRRPRSDSEWRRTAEHPVVRRSVS